MDEGDGFDGIITEEKISMEIILKISSGSTKKSKISLLNAWRSMYLPNFGLPSGIHVTVCIQKSNREFHYVEYEKLLQMLSYTPNMVNFETTTNNRQLSIFAIDAVGHKNDFEPSLTIDKKPRPEKRIKTYTSDDEDDWWYEHEYIKEWNPKEWNIADTGESFILDNTVEIKLDLLPKQDFTIAIKVRKKIKINDILKRA